MSLNLLSLDAHFPKTKYFPATGFATDLRVDHQTVKDTCHFWATHGNTKLGFIYMRWIFTECTMEFIIKPRFGRVLFNFFPSSTIYLEKKLLGGLGWWLGFLGFPYERDWYLGVPLESQTTNPNQQLNIGWQAQNKQIQSSLHVLYTLFFLLPKPPSDFARRCQTLGFQVLFKPHPEVLVAWPVRPTQLRGIRIRILLLLDDDGLRILQQWHFDLQRTWEFIARWKQDRLGGEWAVVDGDLFCVGVLGFFEHKISSFLWRLGWLGLGWLGGLVGRNFFGEVMEPFESVFFCFLGHFGPFGPHSIMMCILPGKPTCPLKINGWKMHFLLK